MVRLIVGRQSSGMLYLWTKATKSDLVEFRMGKITYRNAGFVRSVGLCSNWYNSDSTKTCTMCFLMSMCFLQLCVFEFETSLINPWLLLWRRSRACSSKPKYSKRNNTFLTSEEMRLYSDFVYFHERTILSSLRKEENRTPLSLEAWRHYSPVQYRSEGPHFNQTC